MPYADREKNRASIREYHREHPEEIRENSRRDRAKLRAQTLAAYSRHPDRVPVCACCGEAQMLFLTLDHIDRNGASERRVNHHRGGTTQYRSLRRRGYPPGYQVLCWNCNAAASIAGVCPHRESPGGSS